MEEKEHLIWWMDALNILLACLSAEILHVNEEGQILTIQVMEDDSEAVAAWDPHELAYELMDDKEGITVLLDALKEKGKPFTKALDPAFYRKVEELRVQN